MSDPILFRARAALSLGEPLAQRPRDDRPIPAAPVRPDAESESYAQTAWTARPTDPLLSALEAALGEFEQALETFSWPAALPPLRNGRGDLEADAFPGRLPPRLEDVLADIFQGPPPRVLAEAMANLARDAEDVVMAYNRLRTLLTMNARRLRPEFAEGWRSPLIRLAEELSWLGLEEVGRDKALWARRREFLTGAARLPERAFDVLAGSKGLIPAWRHVAAQARRLGVGRFLLQARSERLAPGPDELSPRPRGLLDLSS